MTPYYQDELVTLWHGDCREITSWTGCDVLLTDPPYGRAWRQGGLHGRGAQRSDVHAGITGDRDTTARDAALAMWRAGDPSRRAILFGDLLLPPPAGTKLVATYMRPVDAGMRGAIAGVRRDQDAIYLAGGWPAGIGGRSSLFATTAVMVGSPSGLVSSAGGHPHTKPQDVLHALIALTGAGESLADPFAGGGSVLVAAKAAGRRAVGVEVEERWCEVAARRLAQDTLFTY